MKTYHAMRYWGEEINHWRKYKRTSLKVSVLPLESWIIKTKAPTHIYCSTIKMFTTLLLVRGHQRLTVLKVPFVGKNLPSSEMNLERSLKMQSSKMTVLPLPVGADTTMFTSEWKQAGKHSLCRELKYLHA